MHRKFQSKTLKGKDHLGDICIDKRILQITLKKKNPVEKSHEHSNETSGSLEGEEFLNYLNGYY